MKCPDTDAKRHHAAAMFAWEKQIATDAALGRHRLAAAGISVILRDKMRHNRETGPLDHRWLARQVGCCVRTVQRVLDALVKCDHLQMVSGKSRGVANRYRALIKENAKAQPVGYDSGVRGGRTPESDGVGLRSPTRSTYPSSYSASWRRPANGHGTAQKRTVIDAANDLIANIDARIAAAEAREARERTGEDPARLLTAHHNVGERGSAAGSARDRVEQVSDRSMDGAVAERLVSKVLGPDGDEILGVLHENEGGRGIYDQLIRLTKAGQTGKQRTQLLEKARLYFLDRQRCRKHELLTWRDGRAIEG